MSSSKLPNYLLSRRKRLGLTQAEVAKVCRYERFVREPSFRTALAFEVIFHESVNDLFAGCFEAVEKEVAARARLLVRRTEKQSPNKYSARKRTILSMIALASERRST
jgi:transcriptional regulator with XRE-family HTH domain